MTIVAWRGVPRSWPSGTYLGNVEANSMAVEGNSMAAEGIQWQVECKSNSMGAAGPGGNT